jgi:ribosome maturation factor RimP
MGKGSVSVQKAAALGEPIAKELGLSLWDVRFEKEGASWFLRYIIDKDSPVTFDDCEAFSRKVDKLLDEEDFIEQSYYLDVSSPGIERELKRDDHFSWSIGKEVKVNLIRPDENGNKLFVGVLNKYENKTVYILSDGKELVFQLSDISSVKLNDDKFFGGNE